MFMIARFPACAKLIILSPDSFLSQIPYFPMISSTPPLLSPTWPLKSPHIQTVSKFGIFCVVLSIMFQNLSFSSALHLVAQLVGRRTRDQEVWGSIPDTGHEPWASFSSYNASVHPAAMGTDARIQGWIDMCWWRPCGSTVPGGKESAEHACMEEDYKLLPLPLPFTSHLRIIMRHHIDH